MGRGFHAPAAACRFRCRVRRRRPRATGRGCAGFSWRSRDARRSSRCRPSAWPSFGFQDRVGAGLGRERASGRGEAATTDTLFQAASISKPVAAMASMKAVQDGRFTLDQDVNTILKSWKLPARPLIERRDRDAAHAHEPHVGHRRRLRISRLHPEAPLPTIVQILDGQPPSNRGAVRLGRPPLTGFKYSGGAVTIQELALTDAIGKPFPLIMRETGARTDRHDEQHLRAAAAGGSARAGGARARSEPARLGDAPWHVYPEHAAAGLWTTPTDLAKFVIEVQQTLAGRSTKVLSRTMLRRW